MIKLSHISKEFVSGKRTVHAVQDVSLTIDKGEIFGMIGFSGAGKSTLVRCINLLERPTSGTVTVDGQDMLSLSAKELRQAEKTAKNTAATAKSAVQKAKDAFKETFLYIKHHSRAVLLVIGIGACVALLFGVTQKYVDVVLNMDNLFPQIFCVHRILQEPLINHWHF